MATRTAVPLSGIILYDSVPIRKVICDMRGDVESHSRVNCSYILTFEPETVS